MPTAKYEAPGRAENPGRGLVDAFIASFGFVGLVVGRPTFSVASPGVSPVGQTEQVPEVVTQTPVSLLVG